MYIFLQVESGMIEVEVRNIEKENQQGFPC